MKGKERYNEAFVYDESSIDREITDIEPRFGAFLRSVVGTGNLVLDVGCGTGRYTAFSAAAGNEVVGSELVERIAKLAMKRGVKTVVVDSEFPFPFDDETFDRVQFIEVVEHLLEPVSALSEINRVLKMGGEMFISTPNAAWWTHRVLMMFGITSFGHSPAYPVEVNMHIRHFTMKTLTQFMDKMGFEVLRTQGTYTGFPGALAEYSPRLSCILNGIARITGGFGFLAKKNVWPALTSAGLVFHVKKIGSPDKMQ